MKNFEIGDLQVIPVRPNNGLIAFANLVLDHQLYLGQIAVYTSLTKIGDIRLVFPARKSPDGRVYHYFHPINNQTNEVFKEAIKAKLSSINIIY